MVIYTIYKATNKVNGKSYIGFDSEWPSRKERHKENIKHRSQYFYNAIKKYGWDNFEWEVLYQSLDGEHCLKVMENHFIVEHRTYTGFSDCKGYNVTLGGEGCLGYKHSEEMREYLSNIQSQKVGILNPFYNKKHSAETLSINRKKNIEILTELKGKKVNQYDMNGSLIATHDSIRSAARSVNLKCYNEISKCCRGIKEYYCGYIWKYA
jgi:group I intron endonuclease